MDMLDQITLLLLLILVVVAVSFPLSKREDHDDPGRRRAQEKEAKRR